MDAILHHIPLVWLLAMTLFSTYTHTQTITPSNQSSDLFPPATSPRFLLNGSTEFPNIPSIRLAPLGPFAQGLSKQSFLQLNVPGHVLNIDASNAMDMQANDFGYLCCDPSAYHGELGPSDVFDISLSNPGTQFIILYSTKSLHCNVSSFDYVQGISGLLTTVEPMNAALLANLGLTAESKGTAHLLPDLNSMTNVTGGSSWGGGSSGILGPSPTTAVAMIILYSITGIITALFIVIIVTGAIRAHRHPERYGPRHVAGRGRQSRAKGIARAMLETLPIVKFGDHPDVPADKRTDAATDIELDGSTAATRSAEPADQGQKSESTGERGDNSGESATVSAGATAARGDGTNDDGSLGCSICTEDFTKGEEVRVLPCNHKFHPECVDPWLLNVSGTCPLCRIDLRPAVPAEENGEHVQGPSAGALPPPLNAQAGAAAGAAGRRDTVTALHRFAQGTREERIAALRTLRDERRRRPSNSLASDLLGQRADRRRLRDRLRERFRIRTTTTGDEGRRGTGDVSALVG